MPLSELHWPEKEAVRGIEQNLQRRHLGACVKGLTESIETSTLRTETLRALKQGQHAFSMGKRTHSG